MKKVFFAIATGLLLLPIGCSADTTTVAVSASPQVQTITAEEANLIMAETDSFVLLDVRTLAEFQETRIDGAILIPYDELMDRAEEALPDKSAVILIYCRSGRRSALVAEILLALGYDRLYDFGGIMDWPFAVIDS